ncbi:MAG: undecaprenyl/decaprenyl-phosphate alpha-N-acetylglucosaminyl 1-phosphate transferase, partial [Chloroflexi bacterium]|nr:undecaprenyl/decaprenyl-phosphate alpha-N-acetylglucosaminyl 1-phosphate transferase [Chloroflexota bacterium]
MTAPSIFFTALLVSLLATPLAGWAGRQLGLVALPGGRRVHPGPVARIGGAGLFAGFLGGALLAWRLAPLSNPDDRLRLSGVLIGAGFVFAAGLLDDWREMGPGPQFLVQFVAALIALATVVFIERFTNPLTDREVLLAWPLAALVTAFWIMGMMNTVNWLDGLDGLAAGVGAIAALLFAAHSYQLGQRGIALYPLALAGACLGFLVFNFHPARVFLGSAGALTLGWGLATLSILAPARVATALLVMAVPITDTAFQIVDRWRHGRSPVRGDRGHLHYRLLDLGLSQHQIVLSYWLFCAAFGALALLTSSRVYKLGA